jgi:hypothetical protein
MHRSIHGGQQARCRTCAASDQLLASSMGGGGMAVLNRSCRMPSTYDASTGRRPTCNAAQQSRQQPASWQDNRHNMAQVQFKTIQITVVQH